MDDGDVHPEAREARLLRRVVDLAPVMVAIVDGEGTVTWVGGASVELTGRTPEDLIGRNFLDYVDVEWSPAALESVGFAMSREGLQRPMLFRGLRKDGSAFIAEVTANAQMDDPLIGGLVVYIRRWDERYLLDLVIESLAGGESLDETLSLLVQVMGAETLEADGAVLLEPAAGRYTRVVAAPQLPDAIAADDGTLGSPWAQATRTGEPQSCPLAELEPRWRDAAAAGGYACCWAWPVTTTNGIEACLVLWRRSDEEPEYTCRSLLDNLVRVTSLVLEREQAARRLRHAADHDVLTGLANRARFYDHLRQTFITDASGPLVGVLYVDLDDFKPVNDRWGHRAGDRLLREVAQRLAGAVRDGDLVARLGGDEFAITCAGVADLATVRGVAERITAAVRRPMYVDGERVTVGVTVGIALAPPRSCSIDLLVDAADGALYEAKRDARGSWHVADPISG